VVFRRQLKRRYVLSFSRSCHHAWSESRRAPHLTIGHASSRSLVTACGLCRRLM
jgi:hypothetical protein